MTRTEETLNKMAEDPSKITNAQFSELTRQLEEDAQAGDNKARNALYALNLKNILAAEYIKITRAVFQQLGTPLDPALVVAGALTDAIETMVQGPMPSLYECLDEMLEAIKSDPRLLAERAKEQANFRARVDLAERLAAEDAPHDVIREKVRRLYEAQLQDVMEAQDRAEGDGLERIAS